MMFAGLQNMGGIDESKTKPSWVDPDMREK
jgi:hypothetical protein